jgi:hypothetical protein
VIGGTRGRKNADGSFTPDPTGQYLRPPFLYSTAVDRDHDGLIRTSRTLADLRAWPAGTDGAGGVTAEVQEAEDECILLYQRTTCGQVNHVSLDTHGQVWVGGFSTVSKGFDVLDATTGAHVGSMTSTCGGYSGLTDANGVLWSASFNQNEIMRSDPVGGSSCIPVLFSAGVAIDAQGYVWNTMWSRNTVAKLTPQGTMVLGFPRLTGGRDCYGVAVTRDGDVWVANKSTNDVSRLDTFGNLRKRMAVGLAPTGVTVDANGRVWVANQNGNEVVRIAPQGGSDGLGLVDLHVALGSGAGPITLGNMAGMVETRELPASGSWTVVVDAGRAGVDWGTVSWQSQEPAGSSLALQVRAADDRNALAVPAWRAVSNGVDFSGTGVVGRYLELQATLRPDPSGKVSPVLFAVTVEARVNAAPECAQAVPSVEKLWPPDGRMVAVEIQGLTDLDGDALECRITAITQDEPLSRGARGLLVADASGLGTATAHLCAKRAGSGNGRVYEIVFVVSDGRGGECTGRVNVCVPHDMGQGSANRGRDGHQGCFDDGQDYDATAGAQKAGLEAGNYPNPFNPSTTIRYTLPAAGRVQLVLYNALGRRVRTLVDAEESAGMHTSWWDGRDEQGREVASGVYVYRLQSGAEQFTQRMLLLK